MTLDFSIAQSQVAVETNSLDESAKLSYPTFGYRTDINSTSDWRTPVPIFKDYMAEITPPPLIHLAEIWCASFSPVTLEFTMLDGACTAVVD